jgi:hypothetical protein
LTHEIKDPASPVTLWLHATFPSCKEIQSAYRAAAGTAQVLPSAAVATGTQGAAIDWWLRFLAAPAVPVDLALAGLRTRRAPCVKAGLELLAQLGALGRGRVVRPVQPGSASLAGQSDEWWARTCYALALMVELFRAAAVEGSRLMRLDADSGASDLLELANADEVADLIAMRDLARRRLLPHLPAGPVATGMTFDGSADLNADADLIAGGVLVDFKAGQGRPRADGARAMSLARTELDQLLGYVLMDYTDTYALHTVAIYTTRFGHYAAWPLADLIKQMAGRPHDLADLRSQFAHVLRVDLPVYWRAHT